MSDCFQPEAVIACYNDGVNPPQSAVIHYYYTGTGAPTVIITDIAGAILSGATTENTTAGPCVASAIDYEKTILCDTVTGHKVLVITDLSDITAPVVSYWDVNLGAEWTGDVADLQACPDTDLESDAIEMCDDGVTFLRWIVKSNGEPTGESFDTDLTGGPYVVTDEAAVISGKCVEACILPARGLISNW